MEIPVVKRLRAHVMESATVNSVIQKISARDGDRQRLCAAVSLMLVPSITGPLINVVRNMTTSVELCAMTVAVPGKMVQQITSVVAQLRRLDRLSGATNSAIPQLLGHVVNIALIVVGRGSSLTKMSRKAKPETADAKIGSELRIRNPLSILLACNDNGSPYYNHSSSDLFWKRVDWETKILSRNLLSSLRLTLQTCQ